MANPATTLALFGLPGGWEMIVILVVVLLLFGSRIPAMARSLGSGIIEFKKGLRGDDGEEKKQPPASGSTGQP
jgi:sec-independent protein translocase protein TatA